MRTAISRCRRAAATAMVFLCVAGTAHAQSAPPPVAAVRAALAQPHGLRDAAARQRVAPQASGRRSGRANSYATKATAVAAMGFVGFFVGAALAGMAAYAMKASGNGGQTIMLTGGAAGAVGGGFLGGWLASR